MRKRHRVRWTVIFLGAAFVTGWLVFRASDLRSTCTGSSSGLSRLPHAPLVFAWLEHLPSRNDHRRHGVLTGAHVLAWRRGPTVFESMAVVDSWQVNPASLVTAVIGQKMETVRAAFVTPNFFEVVDVAPSVGRLFHSADMPSDAQPVVISHALWRRGFGQDPDIVGRAFSIRRRTTHIGVSVIGVTPCDFSFTQPEGTDLWGLLPWERITPSRRLEFQVIGRLRSGLPMDAAGKRLTSTSRTVMQGFGLPEERAQEVATIVEPVSEHISADDAQYLIPLASAFLLLVILMRLVARRSRNPIPVAE